MNLREMTLEKLAQSLTWDLRRDDIREELQRRQKLLDAAEGLSSAVIKMAANAGKVPEQLAEAWNGYEAAKQ